MKLKLKIKLKKIIPYGLLAFYLFFTIISFIYTPPKHNITRKELEEINQKTRLKQNEKKTKNNPQLIQSSLVVEQKNNQTMNEPLEYDKDNNQFIQNEEHIQLLKFQCYDNRTSIYDIFIYQEIKSISQERIVEIDSAIDVPNQIWKQYFLYEYLAPPKQILKSNYSFDNSWKTYFQLTCSYVDQYQLDDEEMNIIEGHNQQLQPSFLNNFNQMWKQYFLYNFSYLDEANITNNIIRVSISDSDIQSNQNDEEKSIIQNDVSDLINDQEDPILSLDQSELNISENQLIINDQFILDGSISQIQIDQTIIGLQNQTNFNQSEQENQSSNTIKDIIEIVEHVEHIEHLEQVEKVEQQQTLQNEEFVQQLDSSQIIDEMQIIQYQSADKSINNTQLLHNESLIEENITIQSIDQMRIATNVTDNLIIESIVNFENIENITQPDRQPIPQCEPTQDDETHDITFLVILILITHIIIFIVEKSKKQNQIVPQEEDNMLTHELFELSVIFQEFIKFQKVYNENVLLSQALLEQSVPYID